LKKAEKNDVRYKIADALEAVMQTKPFSKIRVSDITDECGLSRQTFYRNFSDIYDLANWLHTERTRLSFDIFLENKDVVESLSIKFKAMMRYKNFYRYIAASEGQNSFSDYHAKVLAETCKKHIGANQLNEEILLAVDLYAEGFTKTTINWIRSGMKIHPTTLAEHLYKSMPNNMIKFYL